MDLLPILNSGYPLVTTVMRCPGGGPVTGDKPRYVLLDRVDLIRREIRGNRQEERGTYRLTKHGGHWYSEGAMNQGKKRPWRIATDIPLLQVDKIGLPIPYKPLGQNFSTGA